MLENRKVLTALIGYIMGIIMGLYCKISIVLFYIILYLIYLICSKKDKTEKFRLFSFKRYFRYIRILFTKNVVKLIIIFSIISNIIILYQENKYENLYSDLDGQSCELTGTITEIKDDRCKVKISDKKYKGSYLYVYVENIDNLEYGDEITFSGEFSLPETNTNYKGFNYKNYLKTLKIYGIVNSKKINVISKNNVNTFSKVSKKIFKVLKERIETSNLGNDQKAIIKAILIGDKTDIASEISENFSESNISYILVVSGMHVTYIIFISNFLFNKLIGKHYSKILSSLVIFIYMSITNFTSSVIRAGVVGIISIMSNFFYRRDDIWTSLSISLFLILLYNPYLLLNISLQLSFAGTIGILVFQNTFVKWWRNFLDITERRAIRRNKKLVIFFANILKSNFVKELINACFVTISATIIIIPIMIINFNIINVTSLIVSVLTGFIIGPIVVLGLIFIVARIKIIEEILSIFLKILIGMAEWGSRLPLNQIYFVTPNIWQVIGYYIVVVIMFFVINIKLEKNPTMFYKRIKNLFSFFKYKIKSNKQKIISILLIIILFFMSIKIIPKDLKIYFVDVGQGDCTLIITPRNKSILIDGGGSEWSDYDVRRKCFNALFIR